MSKEKLPAVILLFSHPIFLMLKSSFEIGLKFLKIQWEVFQRWGWASKNANTLTWVEINFDVEKLKRKSESNLGKYWLLYSSRPEQFRPFCPGCT